MRSTHQATRLLPFPNGATMLVFSSEDVQDVEVLAMSPPSTIGSP